jgi:hypothetical protein
VLIHKMHLARSANNHVAQRRRQVHLVDQHLGNLSLALSFFWVKQREPH